MHNVGLYLVAGIVGVFVISSVMKLAMEQAAAKLSPQIQERILLREARGLIWWQSVDILGSALIICGLLKAYGIIPVFRNSGAWGIPSIALGLLSICIASSVRAGLISRYYKAEAPNTPAQKQAFRAALITAFAELSLGAVVCGWIFVPLFVQTPVKRGSISSAALSQMKRIDVASSDKMWITQAEALKLLPGKDAKYLNRLVSEGEVAKKEENNETVYQRNHIIKTVEAGLPIYEDDDDSEESNAGDPVPPQKTPAVIEPKSTSPEPDPKARLKEE